MQFKGALGRDGSYELDLDTSEAKASVTYVLGGVQFDTDMKGSPVSVGANLVNIIESHVAATGIVHEGLEVIKAALKALAPAVEAKAEAPKAE